MRFSRFVRTFGLLLALGLPALGGSCSPSPTPMSSGDSENLRAARKGIHDQLKEKRKAVTAQIEQDRQKAAAARKGGHRGAGVR
jgi:hypothetical protein